MRLTNVKLRRFERGLLQTEVAKRAEIACDRLSAIESGRVEPQPDELQRLAAVLGIATQRLCNSNSRGQ
jgi:transcriptional regulator with XRE-family HTH domain